MIFCIKFQHFFGVYLLIFHVFYLLKFIAFGLISAMIRGDNKGSLAMARNPQYCKRSKHIDLRWHWIHELIEDSIVTVDSCCDPDQTADILTNALHHQKHQKHAKEMGLVSI